MHVLESTKQAISQWFRQLSLRDQRALVVLTIAAVLIALYSLRSTMADSVVTEQKRNGVLLSQLQQMKGWAAEVKSGSTNQTSGLLRALSSPVGKGELAFGSVQPTSEGVAVSASNVPQQQFYRWLEKAQAERYAFVSISVRQATAGVAVSAVIEAE